MALFQNANYDFIKWRWHAMALSRVVIAAGLFFLVTRGIPLGIDFSGGTIMVVKFEQPVTDDQVRQALVTSISGEQVIQTYGDSAQNQKQIRLPQLLQLQSMEAGIAVTSGLVLQGEPHHAVGAAIGKGID